MQHIVVAISEPAILAGDWPGCSRAGGARSSSRRQRRANAGSPGTGRSRRPAGTRAAPRSRRLRRPPAGCSARPARRSRARSPASLSSPGRPRDEAAVDLEAPDREALQVGEARVAGAEVVDRQLHAERRAARCRRAQRLVGILDQDRLGQLELEPAAAAGRRRAARRPRASTKPGCWNCSAETLTDTGTSQAAPRCQAAACAHRLRAAPSRRCATMKPLSSATGMNSPGATSPSSGSRQRSSASAPTTRAAVQVDLRLVVQPELAALERPGASRGRGACARAGRWSPGAAGGSGSRRGRLP